MESELEKSYSVNDSQFTESQRGGFDDSIKFYESVHSLVIDNKTKKTYYRLVISKKSSVPQRYKNFIYIVGNHTPFGKFRGYSEDDENFYPYIEYDPQKTLQNILEGGFDDIFSDTVKCKTVFAIAAALEYCHTLDVSCRFIHPESIFYNKENNPYISNIGYSETILNAPNKVFNLNMTRTDNPIFHDNACYLAPELLKDPNAFSFQSDMYSFGALLLSLITRKKLFESNNEKYILSRINDNQYPKIEKDQCSPLLIDIVQKCLSKNPNERYTSSEVLEKLISTDKPLFPDCDMDTFSKYKKEILKNTYYHIEDNKKISSREAFTIGSRLLKQKSNLENISFSDKKEIFEYFRHSANKGFSPAMYQYALLLDSKIETYVIKAVKDNQPFDPFYWMKKSISNGVYKAPIKYCEMYDRRGYHDIAASEYSKLSPKDEFCSIRSMIISNGQQNKHYYKRPIDKIPNLEVRLETELYEETEKIKYSLTQTKMGNFINKMAKLSKTYKSGKPLYYLAIFYKEGQIPESVRRGINGYLSIDTKIDDKRSILDFLGSSSAEVDDDEDIINEPITDEKRYKEAIKESANLLYEPAVAEYVILLLDNGTDTEENKIKEATDLLNKFFNTFRCLNDYSRIRIQHARAKLLEVNGKRQNNQELVKNALRLYKEAADGGLVAGVADYLRLYNESDDKNDILIKYYQKRLDNFNK